MILVRNENFEISEENGKVFMLTFSAGFPLKEFDSILRSHPRLKLSNFSILKNVLSTQNTNPVEIGRWLPNIEAEVARDKMSASVFIYETHDYIQNNKEKLTQQIRETLNENGIIHGILDFDILKAEPGKAFLIAQGEQPLAGIDAQITYLPKPERKPVIREDGKADYYDMNFISEISEGSWLGEKIPATLGKPGKNVLGQEVAAVPGRDYPIKYDTKSAYEVEEDGKIVIRSKIAGVLDDVKGMIGVNRHLPINGDVGVETGNLEFNGSLSIKGTVTNGYTVIATGDISIEGAEGVSGAKLIKSIEGDVYIRGGIFGLGSTVVEAGGNIFVKHVNEANLFAANSIHIGFYALGSQLSAHSIYVDERKGKIIGGRAVAKNTIVTAISGNRLERRTDLIIESINKQENNTVMQEKAAQLKQLQTEISAHENSMKNLLPFLNQMSKEQSASFEVTKQALTKLKAEAITLDREIKLLMDEMRHVGKEEIIVTKEAHPGTYIQIGRKSSLLSKMTNGKFLLEFGELNV
nr:FapA family protein [uncultured Lysinibacillus sp.]